MRVRIKSLEFRPGIRYPEPPVHRGMLLVALPFPGTNLLRKCLRVGDAPFQALLVQDRQLDLGHVQPTTVLGRVMEFQAISNPLGLLRLEGFVERGLAVRVQIVQHHPDDLGLREMDIHQLLHLAGEVQLGALRRHRDMAPTGQWLEVHEQVRHPVPLVLVVIAGGLARLDRPWQARLLDQLLARLVEADLRGARVIRLGIQIEHVFHAPDVFPTDLWDAPRASKPGLQVPLFRVRRTVSSETASMTPSVTNWSARSCIVQQWRPSGGCVQASAMRNASCLPSSLDWPPGRGCSERAASKPSSTKRWRVRSTVAWPACSIAAMTRSGWPSSASSKVCARRTRRAAALPLPVSASNWARSSSVRSTRYRLTTPFSSAHVVRRRRPAFLTIPVADY